MLFREVEDAPNRPGYPERHGAVFGEVMKGESVYERAISPSRCELSGLEDLISRHCHAVGLPWRLVAKDAQLHATPERHLGSPGLECPPLRSRDCRRRQDRVVPICQRSDFANP